jgi:transposase InsO family protein
VGQPGHYLPALANGNWVYCGAFQDVCTKQVVGWQVRADMPEALVTTALQRALLAQRPAPGLIVHSDRGGQYVGMGYKTLLRDAKAQLSHSPLGRRLRQRPGGEPVVAPQNRTARTARLARVYRPGRRADQRGRLF